VQDFLRFVSWAHLCRAMTPLNLHLYRHYGHETGAVLPQISRGMKMAVERNSSRCKTFENGLSCDR
jgi:hypothetical protein